MIISFFWNHHKARKKGSIPFQDKARKRKKDFNKESFIIVKIWVKILFEEKNKLEKKVYTLLSLFKKLFRDST
jgi:hypothetical protein